MNSGPMQVLGQQYFAWGSISLDDNAAARYNLEGALCTARLETRSVLGVSEQLQNERHYWIQTWMYQNKVLFYVTEGLNKYL